MNQGIAAGIRLKEQFGADFENSLLITVNPKHTKQDLDRLAEVLS